jgi:predicted DsbA family dithiol-disulfide isomerase
MLNVEIWSDIACPWCYVGKRRFERALESFEHRDQVTVTWRSFELDPGAPAERDEDGATHIAHKYGMPVEVARQRQQQLADLAANDGLTFNFDTIRLGNTFDAHRLVHLAHQHGKQDEMKERLMRAYLTESELISDHETLKRLADEIGLPQDEVGVLLATNQYADQVRDDERTAQQFGISAVPYFVVDRHIGVPGAQESELFSRMLTQGWETRPAPLEVLANGETCGPDGC